MFRKLVINVIIIAGLVGIHSTSAGVPGTELYLVSAARTQGAQGSQWYTKVWIHNLSSTDPAHITVAYLERDQSNTSPRLQSLDLEPEETLMVEDVFLDLFGLQNAAGALRFESDRAIAVSARIYNLTADGIEESQGQFMAGMPVELGIGLKELSSIAGITQPLDGTFRCNFALLECTGHTAEVEISLMNGDGVVMASKSYQLRPFEARQLRLEDLKSGLYVDGGRLSLQVTSGSGKILGLASNVANGSLSQDPSTLEMEFMLEQAAPGSGDITAVYATSGLSGGGDSGDVSLGIADQGVTSARIANKAVTTPKISPAGSNNGQILTSTGSGVSWQDPPSGSGDGDITAVAATSGLTGGGTTGDVSLGIADGGVTTAKIANNAITNSQIADGQILTADLGSSVVTKAKLSASGGTSGQVLGTNGSSLLWQNTSAFTLPYSGTTSTSGDVMYLRNSGSGRAIQAVSGSDTAVWAQSTSGTAIDARSSTGIGLVASSSSNDGIQATSAGNGKSAVYGEHSVSNGAAVFGRNTSGNHRGCLGCDDAGVRGDNGVTNGYGILGAFTAGVYGVEGSTWGIAGIFDGQVKIYGNLDVQGTLTKSGGSFKIDHPLDPENQYLSHSFVESPDMMNVYNGNITTNGGGFATVELPEWFEALNREFRYQLTVIGGDEQWALARIAEEINNNAFVIQTNVPNTKVSWQVTGIRQDPWAEAHRIPIEETKPKSERGLFIEPALYGQPADKGINPPPPSPSSRPNEN